MSAAFAVTIAGVMFVAIGAARAVAAMIPLQTTDVIFLNFLNIIHTSFLKILIAINIKCLFNYTIFSKKYMNFLLKFN